jgi:oligosaccharide repeat unit polymerase
MQRAHPASLFQQAIGISYLVAGSLLVLMLIGAPPVVFEYLYTPVVVLASILLGFHLLLCWRPAQYGFIASLRLLVPVCFYATHFLYQAARIIGIVEIDGYTENGGVFFFEATALALAGFLFLLGGIYVAPAGRMFRSPREKSEREERRLNSLARGACIVFCAIFAEEILRIGIGSFISASYNDPELWGRFSRLYDASQLFLMFSLLLWAATLERNVVWRSHLVPLLCGGFWLMFNTMLGYRGHILVYAIALHAVLSLRGHALNRWAGVGILTVALVSLPVLLAARGDSIRERDYRGAIREKGTIESIITTTIHTPGQMITAVARSLELYPRVFPYQLGSTYLTSVAYAVPNVFAGKGRGDMQSFAQNMSAYYFGGISMEGGGQKGVGSTPLAEAYANFSVFGVLVMLLVGYLISWLERSCLSNGDPVWLYFYGITFYMVVWTMRNDSLSWVRSLSWSWLLLMLLRNVTKAYCRVKTRYPQLHEAAPANNSTRCGNKTWVSQP